MQTQVKSLFGAKSTATVDTLVKVQEALPVAPVTVDGGVLTKLVTDNRLSQIPGEQIVMFGSEREKQLGGALDGLLVEITKGSSPVLFELFDKLKKGIETTNLPELEAKIRESQNTSVGQKLLKLVGMDNVAKRLKAANEEVEKMLKSKSTSLLQLTQSMEAQTNSECQKLISDTKKLHSLAEEFRKNITDFQVYVEAGRKILEQAKTELEQARAVAQSGNPLDIEAAERLAQKVELFENRQLALETILTRAPAELVAINLGIHASLQTLAETATGVLADFNSIKSELIKISVAHQIKGVQTLNNARRDLKGQLQAYGTQTLEEVSVNATKSQGLNRLEDATKLLDSAKSLRGISDKVAAEKANNEQRRLEARAKLEETRKLILK
jgi:hypothetical protein